MSKKGQSDSRKSKVSRNDIDESFKMFSEEESLFSWNSILWNLYAYVYLPICLLVVLGLGVVLLLIAIDTYLNL